MTKSYRIIRLDFYLFRLVSSLQSFSESYTGQDSSHDSFNRQYRHGRACLFQIWLRWVRRFTDVPTDRHTHLQTHRSLHLQLHHGVLAQLVPTRRCHLINPDQLGLVAHAISTETLNKPRLTAVLTCGGRDRGRKRGQEIRGRKWKRVITGNKDVWAQLSPTTLVFCALLEV